jgi:hypothetical protein
MFRALIDIEKEIRGMPLLWKKKEK